MLSIGSLLFKHVLHTSSLFILAASRSVCKSDADTAGIADVEDSVALIQTRTSVQAASHHLKKATDRVGAGATETITLPVNSSSETAAQYHYQLPFKASPETAGQYRHFYQHDELMNTTWWCPGVSEGSLNKIAGQPSSSSKVLVAVLAATRGQNLAFTSFKKYVLDALDADLALAITRNGGADVSVQTGPLHDHAKYIFEIPDPPDNDFSQLVGTVSRSCHQRQYFDVQALEWVAPDFWLGGLNGTQPGSGGFLMWFRWLLLQGLHRVGALRKYQTLIITRPDQYYWGPHPGIPTLSPHELMVPKGGDWGGITDKHVVMPMVAAPMILGMLELLTDYPQKAATIFTAGQKQINFEQSLEHYYLWLGVSQIARFPRLMFPVVDRSDVQPGTGYGDFKYHPEVGMTVKYEDEYKYAVEGRSWFEQQGSTWKGWIPDFTAIPKFEDLLVLRPGYNIPPFLPDVDEIFTGFPGSEGECPYSDSDLETGEMIGVGEVKITDLSASSNQTQQAKFCMGMLKRAAAEGQCHLLILGATAPHFDEPLNCQPHVVPVEPSSSGQIGQMLLQEAGERMNLLWVDCAGCEWSWIDDLMTHSPAAVQKVDQLFIKMSFPCTPNLKENEDFIRRAGLLTDIVKGNFRVVASPLPEQIDSLCHRSILLVRRPDKL